MQQITIELLHFIQGVGPNAFSTHVSNITKECNIWCPFTSHKKDYKAALNCYRQDENILDLLGLLKKYKIIVDYIEEDPYFGEWIVQHIETLESPTRNIPIKEFRQNIKSIITEIKVVEKRLFKKLRGLTCLECQRLDETINCNQNNCFLAATVMAVSATEARLHYLINKKNKKIYKECFENASLGELTKLFDENEYKQPKFSKLKEILPKEHRPLLSLFNIYRIVSAHPKAGSIDYKITNSIIGLVFSFLLDPRLKITDKKLLKHQ